MICEIEAERQRVVRLMMKIHRNGFRRTLKSRQAELENGGRIREAFAIDTSLEELDGIQHTQECYSAICALERESMRLRVKYGLVSRPIPLESASTANRI